MSSEGIRETEGNQDSNLVRDNWIALTLPGPPTSDIQSLNVPSSLQIRNSFIHYISVEKWKVGNKGTEAIIYHTFRLVKMIDRERGTSSAFANCNCMFITSTRHLHRMEDVLWSNVIRIRTYKKKRRKGSRKKNKTNLPRPHGLLGPNPSPKDDAGWLRTLNLISSSIVILLHSSRNTTIIFWLITKFDCIISSLSYELLCYSHISNTYKGWFTRCTNGELRVGWRWRWRVTNSRCIFDGIWNGSATNWWYMKSGVQSQKSTRDSSFDCFSLAAVLSVDWTAKSATPWTPPVDPPTSQIWEGLSPI